MILDNASKAYSRRRTRYSQRQILIPLRAPTVEQDANGPSDDPTNETTESYMLLTYYPVSYRRVDYAQRAGDSALGEIPCNCFLGVYFELGV